ncbi:MAG: DUF502 domain-containing protein [Ferruginibacter sp.]
MTKPFTYKKFLQYFLQGLLILAPIAITLYSLYWIYDRVDSILRPVVHIPGIGFIVIIAFVIFIGWLSSFFVMGRVLSVFDNLLEKTPGIKLIYGFIKDFFEAFAGDKKKFTNNVLANVDDNNVWRMGFITKDDMVDFGLKDYVAVYVPMAYSVAGNVYIIPRDRIKVITNISATQTMKFAVSGGVADVDELQTIVGR